VKVLALDLATRTGWALWDGERMESGVQVFDVRRGESPGMRYLRFNAWLGQMAERLEGQRPDYLGDVIAYEQTVPANTKFSSATTREIAAGFSTRVQEKCAAWGIQHFAIYPSSLKKFTTGNGRSKKPEMVAAVSARWKAVKDDNEADAIALLHYALAELVTGAPE
jgi:Holliday junction resolvasome RuvABC endonuclease subunit